jgi:hypothetical protein
MSLEQWLRNNWLQRSEPTIAEIQQLLQVVDRELADAQVPAVSVDGRFQHAYEAALQLCMMALRACGYRVPKGAGHHKRGIDSLRLTLGEDWSESADHIERCSRRRAQLIYERVDVVSEEDADDLIDTAKQLRADVVAWLKAEHAELVPTGI